MTTSCSSIPTILRDFQPAHEVIEMPKKEKKVVFDSVVHVVLIPTKEEYKDAHLCSELWYSPRELHEIEKEALVSLSAGNLLNRTFFLKKMINDEVDLV